MLLSDSPISPGLILKALAMRMHPQVSQTAEPYAMPFTPLRDISKGKTFYLIFIDFWKKSVNSVTHFSAFLLFC